MPVNVATISGHLKPEMTSNSIIMCSPVILLNVFVWEDHICALCQIGLLTDRVIHSTLTELIYPAKENQTSTAF